MNMFNSFFVLASLLVSSHAAPAPDTGLKFEKRAGALPTLTLPYGTWRAAHYNPDGDVRCSSANRTTLFNGIKADQSLSTRSTPSRTSASELLPLEI